MVEVVVTVDLVEMVETVETVAYLTGMPEMVVLAGREATDHQAEPLVRVVMAERVEQLVY